MMENLLEMCGRDGLKEHPGSGAVDIGVNPSGPRRQALI